MVIVDDLVAWLIGLLGDAARKGLVRLAFGSDLERALRETAKAALTETANELMPGGGEPAEILARVVGEVFDAHRPREFTVSASGTLLAAISAGVAGQVAVLDDVSLTGQDVSSAEVLGVPATVIGEHLTEHLIAQIKNAGLGGGPLKPLADQLNHDLTHQQNQDILRRLPAPAETATDEQFAADLRALLEALVEQAEHGRLPSYLWGRVDVIGLTRAVKVRAGIRTGDDGGQARGLGDEHRAYALAADRDEAKSQVVPWADAAARDRVVVLADPGMGKSWLIRTEARRLASTALAWADGDLARVVVPIPLRCDQLAAAEGVDLPTRAAEFLAAQGLLARRSQRPLADLIRTGRAVLLLDALDELTAREAGEVRALMWAWAERAGKRARCVITSRIAGYTGAPLPGAAEVELQPFTPTDVTAVIRAWGLPPATERELLSRAGDPAVAAMARVPLLLALLCALAGAQPTGTGLPRTRRELYERVLRWFLTGAHRAADNPAAAPLTDLDVEARLELLGPVALAYATRPGGWVDLMPAGDLLNTIRSAGPAYTELSLPAAEVLIDLSARAGIFVPDRDPSEGRPARYLFLHRTFAEYLVARRLAAMPAPDWLAVITEHQWFDPDWQAVIPMLGGLLRAEGAGQLVTHLLASDPDPFWHGLLMAIAVAGERQDADKILTAGQFVCLAKAVSILMDHDLGRRLIADRMAGLTSWPGAMRTAILGRLHDQDWLVRAWAGRALAGRGGQDVTDALLHCLHDQDFRVREAAIEALAGREGQDVTDGLLDSLKDGEYVREAAAEALAGREGLDVIDTLLDHLNDPDEDVRCEVRWAVLPGRQGQDVTDGLLARLDSPDSIMREAAAEALAGRQGQDVTDALVDHLNDPDEDVREAAAKALAGRDGEDVTDALVDHLNDPDEDVREAAAKALAGRDGEDVTDALLARLNDQDWRVRRVAAVALAGRDGQDVKDALLARLDDQYGRVREATADALAGRDGWDVTDALLARLNGQDWIECSIAAKALAGRDGQDVTDALLVRLHDENWVVRRVVTEALAGRDGPDVTDALLARSKHSNEDMLRIEMAAQRGGRDVTDGLLARLHDADDKKVHHTVMRALAGRDGQDVTDALLARLDDQDWLVREAAARALGGRESQDVTAALLACSNDANKDVREAAAEAISRQTSPADLLMLALHAWPDTVPAELLDAAYTLTTHHYQALPFRDQQMIRARMSRLTLAPSLRS